MAASWLKRGNAAKALVEREKVKQAERQEDFGRLRRFFLDPGEDAKITFVDGALDAEGMLDPPRVYEHFHYPKGGVPRNYVCPEQTDPESGQKCPLCEMGNNVSLVSFFTIIDHRVHKAENGKTYTNQRRLLAVKPTVFEKLNKKAGVRQGLIGTTWQVSRTNKKVAATGDDFDFIQKADPKVLKPMYMMDVKDAKGTVTGTTTAFIVADYEKEITYKTEDQLRQMGFGVGGSGPVDSGYSHSSHSEGQSDGFTPIGGSTAGVDTTPADDSEVEQHL